jgi:hypothetical protein
MSAALSSPNRPLHAVLEQVGLGTPTVTHMARNTGISEDVVRASLDHLLRTGRLQADELPIGCPPGGCGGCAAAAGCGLPSQAGGRRVVTLSLARAT